MKTEKTIIPDEVRELFAAAPALPDYLMDIAHQDNKLSDDDKGALLFAACLIRSQRREINKKSYVIWKQENKIKRLRAEVRSSARESQGVSGS